MGDFYVIPGGPLRGDITIASDKSISHRALMLGAIAEGTTEVHGFLESLDCLATMDALRAMGVRIDRRGAGELTIFGVGREGLKAPLSPLDLGNSATALRLMAGLLAGQTFDSVLTGDSSLCTRPMERIRAPLTQMGALIDTERGGVAPLKIRGSQVLHGTCYTLPILSAQVKSALLLAGLFARGEMKIDGIGMTRDHTERMLRAFSYPLKAGSNSIALTGGGSLKASEIHVPGDLSSASFFIVAASLTPGSELIIHDVGLNPTRTAILEVLKCMGGSLEILEKKQVGQEEIGTLRVKYARLRGIEVPKALVPSVIDELPILFIAAAAAVGETVISGAGELRFKESDRLDAMVKGLKQLGIQCMGFPDGVRIEGGVFSGGALHSFGDHRVAMSFTIAGHIASNPVLIEACDMIDTSYPGFKNRAQTVGISIEERNHEIR